MKCNVERKFLNICPSSSGECHKNMLKSPQKTGFSLEWFSNDFVDINGNR